MKRRLVLAIAGVAASAVALFALPLGAALQRGYRSEELLRLQRDTVAATRAIDLRGGGRDRLELPPSGDALAIYDAHGVLLAGRGQQRADAATASALRTRRPTGVSGAGRLEVAVPVLKGERVDGVVRAQRGAGSVNRRTHRAWLALAGLAAGLMGLAVLAALWLARRLARPLDTLAAAARRVGEGDFAARVSATGLREIDDVGAALNRSSGRIDELVSRERTFSADASHQLRTPLAALRLELEALAMEEPERSHAGLGTALSQVERLEATIATLLSVTRGNTRGDGSTDLSVLVRELESRWHGRLAAAGRPLLVRLEARPAIGAISGAVLREITEVLVENAYNHGAGAVTITVRRSEGALALEVSDRGAGFGPDPEAAFARGAGRGHGIGLALARSLAHAEGARLLITGAGPEPVLSVLIPPAD